MLNSDRFHCPQCGSTVPMAHTLTESVYGERMCSDCWDDEEGGY